MRIPFTKLHRAFPEFDSLSEEECARYVRYVLITRGASMLIIPSAVALGCAVGWPTLLVLGVRFQLFPVPNFGGDLNLVLTVASSVLVGSLAGLITRDLLVWWHVRVEVHRARCPECKQSLQGLPIEEVGLGLDPAMRFVRCTECGLKHRLLDLGLTPMDLVPFEQRGVPEDFGRRRD
jgi:hypothetical protein